MSTILILNDRTRFPDMTGAGIMRNRCAFTSRDMAADWPDAFTYAIVVGWGRAMRDLAEKYEWDDAMVEFLRDAHKRFIGLPDKTEPTS